MFLRGKILFQPKNRALIRRCAQGQGDDETCGCACIAGLIGKNLMNRSMLQTIAEDPVDATVTQIKGGALSDMRMRLSQSRNIAPQCRKIDNCHPDFSLNVHDMFYYEIGCIRSQVSGSTV